MLCYYPLESELGPKVYGAPNFLCPPPPAPPLMVVAGGKCPRKKVRGV